MKKTVFIFFVAFFAVGYCQIDTIPTCERFAKYQYDSLWADNFSMHCQGSCDIRGSVWETVPYRPSIVTRQCHTDTTIYIAGIAAPVYYDTTINYLDNNRVPEYFYLYTINGTEMSELGNVRWDNTIPNKVMQFYGLTGSGFPGSTTGHDFPYGDVISSYPVYEAYFYKPIPVNGTFYVGGSTNNNFRVSANTYAHPGTRYLRWSFKYQTQETECINNIPRPEDNDLIMYIDETSTDTAFHSNSLLWPGFGCIFPIFFTPEDSTGTHNDTCLGVSGLRVLDISDRNVTIIWDNDGSTDEWELAIVKGDTTTAMPQNGVINNYSTNLATLYNLDSAWFSVFVRKFCNDNLISEWSEPIHFHVPQPTNHTEVSLADFYTVLSPNPTDGKIDIFSSFLINQLTVLSTNGTPMTKYEIQAHSSTIDLSHHPSGTYILQINTSVGTVTKRIVKK